MTARDAALAYGARRWPVFPCHWQGERRKRPLIQGGFHAATTGETLIREWWHRWPDSLVGVSTGRAIGVVVLDIDVKDNRANGFDTLDALGFSVLPETPIVHTASGGLHLYFSVPNGIDLRNTVGERGSGIGPGLDWRGDGGYVIAPSPGSGYSWDLIWNLDTAALAPVPIVLLPRSPERCTPARPVKPTTGLSPYAEAALDSACRRIIGAPDGQQESTLNAEAFTIGTLAGGGALPSDFARRALIWAAQRIPDYDHRRPWQAVEITAKVERAFSAGMSRPRSGSNAA
jgi:hypothetical protein